MNASAAAFLAALVFPPRASRATVKAFSIISFCSSFTKNTNGFANFDCPARVWELHFSIAVRQLEIFNLLRRSICRRVAGRSFARSLACFCLLSRLSKASFFSSTSEPPRRFIVASSMSASRSSTSQTITSAVLYPSPRKA